MTTRKPSRKPTAAQVRPKGKAAQPDFNPPAPAGNDPESLAKHILGLLDALGKQGTAEARRLRDAVVKVVADYRDAPDKQKAREELKLKLLGLEVGAAELLSSVSRKLRDKIAQASRRLGTKSPEGRAAQVAVQGLTSFVEGLTKLLDAARVGSEELREQGRAEVAKAQEILKAFGK